MSAGLDLWVRESLVRKEHGGPNEKYKEPLAKNNSCNYENL